MFAIVMIVFIVAIFHIFTVKEFLASCFETILHDFGNGSLDCCGSNVCGDTRLILTNHLNVIRRIRISHINSGTTQHIHILIIVIKTKHLLNSNTVLINGLGTCECKILNISIRISELSAAILTVWRKVLNEIIFILCQNGHIIDKNFITCICEIIRFICKEPPHIFLCGRVTKLISPFCNSDKSDNGAIFTV